ncbi:MAG: hypothetical protein C0591_07410 [Marinilabiliales bacterium]|nr:MAG: hypothetical protein C0591_07410 [Marinilabiliales bacterium]
MKALKYVGIFMLIIIALLVISMFVVPQFYKDKIGEIAKTEINNQLNAEVDFGEIDLSLFRNFPNFSLGLHDLTIMNLPEDTLIVSKGIYITVGLFSVLKDETIEIKSITVDQPRLFLNINREGEENWNILKETETSGDEENTESEPYILMLNKVLINAATIHYTDNESGIELSMDKMNWFLKGNITEDKSDLDISMNSEDVTLLYEEIAYLQHVALRFDAKIDANLKDEIYNLKNNSLYLNGLRIYFEGSVAYVGDDINMMLVYSAPDNSFKQLLSLIPVVYNDGYEKLVTSGQFNMDGHIKGIYSETDFPDFKLEVQATNAEISYPDMATSVKNIDFGLLVENEGNNLDNTVIRLDKLSGSIGKDKLELSLLLTHPISDPFIDLKASASITFENLKNVFPQESFQELTGDMIADISLKGSLSSIEKKDYKNFLAMGSLVCNNINYQMEDNYAILLQHAQFNFSPSQIDIIGLESEVNGYNLLVDGKFNNYLGYFLNDEMFKGHLNIQTKTLNINQLLEPWSGTESDTGTTEDSENVVYIPKNIDVFISAKADSITYDKLSFTNFNSSIHIYNGKIEFEDFKSSFLGGLIEIKGYYEATTSINPHIDMRLKLTDLGVSNAYQYLSLFEKFTPIAEKAKGIFDASINLNMELDQEMNPVWSSILGNGDFISEDIELSATELFSKISNVLKIDAFENPSTGPIDLSFNLLDGKIFHKPFNITMDDIQMEVSGWTGLDQQIDYNLTLDIPVKMLGERASSVIDYYAKEIGKLGFDLGDVQSLKPVLKVEGTASDPKVSLVSLGKLSGNGIKDVVKDKVEDVVQDYLEEANKEAERILAEAQKEADAIIKSAQQKADQVMQVAEQTVNNLKNEARIQSEQLVKEAAKQGALAELAAKKAAQELLKNADAEANKVLQQAQQQSDKIMENARKQSEATMQRALEKADKIRNY